MYLSDILWSSALKVPKRSRAFRFGWPTSKRAKELDESISVFVNYAVLGIIDVMPST